MTLDELVKATAEAAIEQRLPVSQVIDVGDFKKLSAADRTELARQGMVYMANNEVHHQQRRLARFTEGSIVSVPSVGGVSVLQTGHPHPRDEEDVLKKVFIATADQKQLLPIIELPLDDMRAALNECRAQAHGWARKARGLEIAIEACEDGGVDKLKDLPDDALSSVRRAFGDTWAG